MTTHHLNAPKQAATWGAHRKPALIRPILILCGIMAGCSRESPPSAPTTQTTPPDESAVALPDAALAALRDLVGDGAPETRYFASTVDLNQDGKDEIVAYIAGPMVCGTGGCNTIVLTPQGEGYRVVGDIPITNPPIRVAGSSSQGWRDLIVEVSGGGGPAGPVLLRFDGQDYPDDPSGDDAQVLSSAPAEAQVLIKPFGSFAEGKSLYASAPPTG